VNVLKQIINQDPAGIPKVDRPGGPVNEPISPAQPIRTSTSHSHSSPMSASKNILSNDVEIIGNLKFSHDLIIDGKIEGEVNSDGNLTVGENARVKGEIKTKSVTVFGKVEGNITVTDRCELKSNAELHGDISAGTLAIEEGAQFMGASRVGAAARGQSASETKPPLPGTPPRPAPIVNP
jgi:cytoskeletal protein CcmA (bactofilin family)